MRLSSGVLKDWTLHFERLRKGVEFLYGPFAETENWSYLLKERLESKLLKLDGDKIIRLSIYLEQERGLIQTPIISIHDLKVNISQTLFDSTRFENKRLKLRTCPAITRPHWWPSFLKAGNYLETILSQKMFLRPGDDDLLFLSSNDSVLESSVANIFVVRKNKLFTAPTGPNVLSGIMRHKVLNVADEFFTESSEAETSMDLLRKCDAIFGSNSVRGLFLVDRIDDYEITYSEEFLEKFRKLNERVNS